MLRSAGIYCFLLLVVMACLVSCRTQNNLPSLKETFARKDKIPFGGYVAYSEVEQLFYRNTIRERKQDFETSWNEMSDTGSVYVCIAKNIFLTPADKNAMLDYVRKGNSLFISSDNIDTTLLEELGCKVTSSPFYYPVLLPFMTGTSVQVDRSLYSDSSRYGYFYYPLTNHFSTYDEKTTRVLGMNEHGKGNYIVVFYGNGRFYLHCEPRALSNYFLLQKENYRYMARLFSFTPATPEYVYWDDYYNRKNSESVEKSKKGLLGVLLQYESMSWAFWLLLLLLALYVLFGGKRRQRIIETIAPNTNTTVAFTETVGRLYLQKKDNKNIADKMITYFWEHIRNQYFLNTNQINDEFITTLSRKSGVAKEITEKLFKTIAHVQVVQEISDQELLSLNQQIENFNKNKT